MGKEEISFEQKELEFNKFIVSEYLRYGSVDEVFKTNNYSLPISYPGVQRLLGRWGIVKAAGPNATLSECISFLARLVEEQIPLEALYKKMPPSFRPSVATLHRMYGEVKREVKKKIENRNFRRVGTALVITPYENQDFILLGRDISTPRLDLGKTFGAISPPMGFSKKNEGSGDSILRVLQQEVFAKLTIERKMPNIISRDISPFMFVDIADVRVAVYKLILPYEFFDIKNFSSFKLKNHKFVNLESFDNVSAINRRKFRSGMFGIVQGLKEYSGDKEPFFVDSFLNQRLALLASV